MRGMCVSPSNRYKREKQIAEHSTLLYPSPHNYFDKFFLHWPWLKKTVPHCINYLLKVYDSILNCDCFSFAFKLVKIPRRYCWYEVIQNYECGSGMAWHILHKSSLKKKKTQNDQNRVGAFYTLLPQEHQW